MEEMDGHLIDKFWEELNSFEKGNIYIDNLFIGYLVVIFIFLLVSEISQENAFGWWSNF